MAFDNFTIHRYRALKECPQGQLPGQVFEATEDVGDILISFQSVERVPDDTPLGMPKGGTYKRRDLVAEKYR
jgi:hypothetical protein